MAFAQQSLPKWMPAALVMLIAAAYANSLGGAFVLDDFQMIVQNEPLHHLWPVTGQLWSSPASGTSGRPVSAFSLALNYAAGRLHPVGYHVTNVALHAACALLLLLIVHRTLLLPQFVRRWSAPAAATAAFLVAALWAVHPLTTDTVTYLSSRTELLFALLLLLTVYARLRAEFSARRRAWLAAAVIACALGMGSKEVMVVAPLIVLVYDAVFLRSSPLRANGWFYAALAASWLLLAALLLRPELAIRGETNSITPWLYLKTQAGVIAHYFRLALWPAPLVVDYFDWPMAHRLADVLPQAVLIVLLLALSAWGLMRRHCLGFAGAWVFLILAPTSSIYPIAIEVATERRMYLPLAGIVAALVIGGMMMLQRRGVSSRIVLAGGACAAVALAMLTIRRNEDYRDQLALTRATLEARPNNARAWIGHGMALAQTQDMASALGALEQAVRVAPRHPHAYLARGRLFAQVGDSQRAIDDFNAAMGLDAQMPEPHYELGKVHMALGDKPAAEKDFRAAIEKYPQWTTPRTYLAGLLIEQRRFAEAEQLLAETARLDRFSQPVQEALRAVRAARRDASAQPATTRALTIHP